MPAPTITLYSSRDVCDLLGISYRQLDYLTRTGAVTGPDMNKGSGSRRTFTPDQVQRLAVARRLADNIPTTRATSGSVWPRLAAAVMAGPPPPPRGFAVLDTVGTVRYPTTLTVDDVPNGSIVMNYDASDVWAALEDDQR